MMSFRKLVLPAFLVAAFAFFGAQGSAWGVATPEKDGKISAEEIRAIILDASDVDRTSGRITPRVANMSEGHLGIGSSSCAKGKDWKWFRAFVGRDGGTLCNGARDWRKTNLFGPQYFKQTMRSILDHVIAETNLEDLGPGRIIQIHSKGKSATLRYRIYKKNKPTNSAKIVRIIGSSVEVINPR